MLTHDWRSPVLVSVALLGCLSGAPGGVRPGIDVLLTDSLHLVRARRVGLVTNQTGVDARGVDDITRLLAAGVRLTAIFSPEHGFRGQVDVENIGHGVDSATGIPIYSLYREGEHRGPDSAMLADVDVLVVDLQDVGARPYTYITTVLRTLVSATEREVPVLVLDRPNPIGGVAVAGPVLDPTFRSEIGMLPVPMRHGMTIGELARFGRETLGIGGALTVVPAAGWERTVWFDGTGLPWIRPSPSLPSLESATHYPGLVLFEATNLSVGRGTAVAFQVVGAPWLDPRAVIRVVGPIPGAALSDTVIVPVEPSDAKYPGVPLRAIGLRAVERDRYDPVATAIRLLLAVRTVHGDSLRLSAGRLDRLAGTDAVRRLIEQGGDPEPVLAEWAAQARRFRDLRKPFLLYSPELP